MPTFTRVLLYRLPMLYGSDVQAMQMRLHSHGVRQVGVADGLFGSQTDVAVRAFQQAHGLRIDGVVGPLTWEALFEDVKHQEIDTKVELFWEELQQPHGFGKEEDIGTSCQWSLASESEEKIIKRMGIKISKPPEIPIDEWPDSNPSYYPQTRGKPKTVQEVWQNFGGSIEKWALQFGIPVELIVATICTESRGDPEAVREEPNYVSDEKTPHQVSPGLMQTLISTARETLGDHSIDREWLLIPEHSIRAGTAYIARQWKKTHLDPPKVACAYNAGGVYYNKHPANHWKMRQYPINSPHHADRFVEWFNDCLRMFKEDNVAPRLSFHAKLKAQV